MSLGTDLKAMRKARGLTQRKLAKVLRVSQTLVALIEEDRMDEARPGKDLLARLRHWAAKGGKAGQE